MQRFKSPLIVLALVLVAGAGQAGPFLYVPTDYSNQYTFLAVIDTLNGSVGNVLIPGADGTDAVTGVAFSPAGDRIYAASRTAVSVITTADNQIVTRIPVVDIEGPRALLINPAGTLLYVTTGSGIQVIDTGSNTVIGPSTLFAPFQLAAFNPNGTWLYRIREVYQGTVELPSVLEIVDIASNAVAASVDVGYGTNGKGTSVGQGNHDLAVNLSGTRVYVLNSFSALASNDNSVTVIDPALHAVLATIPVGNLPERLIVNSAGTRVYVSVLFSEVNGLLTTGHVAVIDAAANSLIATIPTGATPRYLGIDAADTRLYVQTQQDTGETAIVGIDTGCNTATAAISPPIFGTFHDLYMVPPRGPPAGGPPPASPIQVTGMEVTQGIQDLADSVPLISGRRTFVRVYVKTDGATLSGITAILSGVGNIFCNPGSCPPSGTLLEPLTPVNPTGLRISVGPNPKRNNLNDSFLFELPWTWTQYQSLHLHAVVSQGPGVLPTQSCRSDVEKEPLHEFKLPTTLKVQFVRLSYRLPGTFNGITNALVETSLGEQASTESYIRRAYPLSTLVVAPDFTLFDAGLGNAVSRLLTECVAADPKNQSLCAHNYIVARLAELKASSAAYGLALGPPGSTQPDTTYALIPQVPNDPKGLFFTRGACCTSGIGAGPSTVADYAAHEIGHFLGRQHPVEGAALCGHDGADANFPYFQSLIAPPLGDPQTALLGFDSGDPNLLIPPDTRPVSTLDAKPVNNFDIMGYCKPAWISDYTYNNLYSCLSALDGAPGVTPGCGPSGGAGRNDPPTPQTGDWLTIAGNITPANTANFSSQRVERNYSPPPGVSGDHSIRLIGMPGVTLADYPFTPDALADAATPGSSAAPRSFGLVVPFVAGTRSIQIVDTAAKQVIGERSVSPNPPAISNVLVQSPPDPVSGAAMLTWTAVDADGDPLTYDVFFTRDAGSSLLPLVLGVSATSTPVDTSNLGGGTGQFRVMATDGVHSAHADSPLLTLANKPPKPRIETPGNVATIHVGQLVNFEGAATDAQDGVLGEAALVWSTSSGRPLGSGSRMTVTDLPLGVDQVVLTATNSAGLSATSTTTVTVLDSQALPAATLTAGTTRIGWHVAVGETQLQTAALDVGNAGSGTLSFTAQSSADWLTLSVATATAPATITVTANPAGFGDGLTQEATVTLTSGAAAQSIEIPVTLSIGNTFVVGKVSATPMAPPPPADFAVAASSESAIVTAGQSAQTTLTLSPSNGFNGSVSLSCAGLPSGAACNFSPSSLVVGSAVTSTLTIATAARTAANSPNAPFDPLAPGGLLLASIAAPVLLRRRTFSGQRRFAFLGLLLSGAMMLQACHGSADVTPISSTSGTPAGTYSLRIGATDGTTAHNLTYVLTVN